MTKKPKKSAEKRPKMVPAERKAVQILAKNPDMGNSQISRELKDLGLTRDEGYVRKRLTKSDYLRGEIDRIRQVNQEMMSREVVPEAIKIHKRVLKNKNIPDEKKKDWVALAEKAEFGTDETKRPTQAPMVNLVAIQKIILEAVSMPPEDKNVIDVTEN